MRLILQKGNKLYKDRKIKQKMFMGITVNISDRGSTNFWILVCMS